MAAPPTTMDEPARTDASDGERASSPGALLRAAREGQGMHIATLAAAIKVAPRKLEALEQDRWHELPGPTFTRALAQAVCRALKTDPQPVMDLLPPADTSMLDSSFGTINEPFSGTGREAGVLAWLPRGPWLIAAIVLLLAAALVMWLPSGSLRRMLPGGVAGGERSATVTTPSVAPAPAGVNATVPAAVPAAAPAAGTVDRAAPAAAVPAPSATPAPAAEGAASLLPAGDLLLQCSARSWIEVVDAGGRVLVSRNLEAGESLGLDGLAPLQVVVGNAAATRVTYKGRPVELEGRARDNVARFELR